MTTTSSIAELLSAGVRLEAAEAVAITQQLIQSLRGASASTLEPPYGPPTAATVVLGADGSVSCIGCGSTPAISEVAIFLDALLQPGAPRVPGGLRYTLARALLEVDVAPFDSLDAFSLALARHERGDRAEAVRRLVRRAEPACAAAAVTAADRRRPRASATELRRALREADARLYAQQTRSLLPPPPRQSAMRTMPAVAACVGTGLMLIATGEFMKRSERPVPPPAAVVASVTVPANQAMPAPRAILASDRSAVPPSAVLTLGTVSRRPATAASASKPSRPTRGPRVVQRERTDRVSKARPARAPAVKKARDERRGVLDRLRLGWLTKKFAVRQKAL